MHTDSVGTVVATFMFTPASVYTMSPPPPRIGPDLVTSVLEGPIHLLLAAPK